MLIFKRPLQMLGNIKSLAMKINLLPFLGMTLSFIVLNGCEKSLSPENEDAQILAKTFGSNINLTQLDNYASQPVPVYITQNNAPNAPVSNEKATLGRVLFYDKELSIDRTISCASCHQQAAAFGDVTVASKGVNGNTGRHSMRLINAKFARLQQFFWDKRAPSLELQVTQPIKDHLEMGFSGIGTNASFNDLTRRLSDLEYYPILFRLAYGDASISEARIQESLAHFIRSIQSFDSKYDAGLAQSTNIGASFPNFSQQENMGKMLFTMPPNFDANGNRISGGIGCNSCHQAPEFDGSPASGNNGVIRSISGEIDLTNTRSPSLRDLFGPNGSLNGPLMHNGAFTSLEAVLAHYNDLTPNLNPQLDTRLRPAGNALKLNLTQQEINAVVAFMKTLTGQNVYTDKKWADPFVRNGGQ